MKNKKEKQIDKRSKKAKTLEDGKITNCPTCGVDLNGNESCAYITCPCAPRITV